MFFASVRNASSFCCILFISLLSSFNSCSQKTQNPIVGIENNGDEFDQLRLKWKDLLIGKNYSRDDIKVIRQLAIIDEVANTHWTSMNRSEPRTSLWPDLSLDYGSSHITKSYERLAAMSLAYATAGSELYENQNLLADMLDGLDWLDMNWFNSQSVMHGNWWDWKIGVPMQLTNIGVLLYDQLSEERLKRYMDAVEHQTPVPNLTHANLVWKARVVAVRGSLIKDAKKIELARDSLSAVFPYIKIGDGFYKDGSFIQHRMHPYTAGYGSSLLGNLSKITFWLHDTPWKIVDPNLSNVYQWVFDSYEPIIYRGNLFDLVRGREAGRKNTGSSAHYLMDSILLISQFAPEPTSKKIKELVKGWASTDTNNDYLSNRGLPIYSIAKSVMEDSAIIPRPELIGHYNFARMDRVIHLGQGYGFGISMHSNRIQNFESINGENLRGWFTGDGQTTLFNGDLRAFSDGYWATVDHYRLPGVTADVSHPKLPHNNSALGPKARGQSSLSFLAWVGGSSLGEFGIAGMNFQGHGVSLKAKKSWFMFDDEIVCLGAGITSQDARPIETTIEQRKLNSNGSNTLSIDGITKNSVSPWTETHTNASWAHLVGNTEGADIGYVFGQNMNLRFLRELRSGSWRDIDHNGSTDPIERYYIRMSVEHGSNPSDATYSYTLLPGMTANETEEYSLQPDVEILANNRSFQAVYEKTLGITGVNFWKDEVATLGPITVNKRASVILKESDDFIELSVSDPTQINQIGIEITLDRKIDSVISKDEEFNISYNESQISLTLNTLRSEGKSFRAKFQRAH